MFEGNFALQGLILVAIIHFSGVLTAYMKPFLKDEDRRKEKMKRGISTLAFTNVSRFATSIQTKTKNKNTPITCWTKFGQQLDYVDMNRVETYSLACSLLIVTLGLALSLASSNDSYKIALSYLILLLNIGYTFGMIGLFLAFFVYEKGPVLQSMLAKR